MTMSASEMLDREFLDIRCKIVDLAASLDRLDRADGTVAGDARIDRVQQAIGVLQSDKTDRSEQIQLVFSLPYEEGWRRGFGLQERGTDR